jgi:hypothetical protein
MTEHEHDEIGRRLRESGTVPAPDRLRAEVMDQVRAEPRARPARRSLVPRLLPYAAAAGVLAALVLALSHLGGSGMNGSASSGGASAGGGKALSPEAAAPGRTAADDQLVFDVPNAALQKLTSAPHVKSHTAQGAVVLAVPYSRFNDYRQRLHAIEARTSGDDTIRVILRPRATR